MRAMAIVIGIFATLLATGAMAASCVDCHEKETPGAVAGWKLSKHSANDVECDACHGDGHT